MEASESAFSSLRVKGSPLATAGVATTSLTDLVTGRAGRGFPGTLGFASKFTFLWERPEADFDR